MNIFGKVFNNDKIKKIVYTVVFVALLGWFVFRFVSVALESRMDVYNPMRETEKNGVLVNVINVSKQDGVVAVPLDVQNNRAYVSNMHRKELHSGQKVGDGVISYVSNSLDLDSGMYVVKTKGVTDGINYAQIHLNGYCMPTYAVHDGVVMVENSGKAEQRNVKILAQDSDVVCVSDGLNDGDKVILSRVSNGQKVNVIQ